MAEQIDIVPLGRTGEEYARWWESLPDCSHCEGLGLIDCGNTSRTCTWCDDGKILPNESDDSAEDLPSQPFTDEDYDDCCDMENT